MLIEMKDVWSIWLKNETCIILGRTMPRSVLFQAPSSSSTVEGREGSMRTCQGIQATGRAMCFGASQHTCVYCPFSYLQSFCDTGQIASFFWTSVLNILKHRLHERVPSYFGYKGFLSWGFVPPGLAEGPLPSSRSSPHLIRICSTAVKWISWSLKQARLATVDVPDWPHRQE